MKKFLLLLLVINLSNHSKAQFQNYFEKNYSNSKTSIQLGAEYLISSNSITNEFVKAYLSYTYIDSSLKNKVIEREYETNRFGGEIQGNLYFSHHCDTFLGITDVRYFVSARNRIHFNSKFPKGLFGLYFYGNSPYKGQSISLNDFSLNLLSYQQLQFGLVKNYNTISTSYRWGASLSILKGQENLKIDIPAGSFFTQTDGEYINLVLDMKISQSDTSRRDILAYNGIGSSADLFFSYSNSNALTFSLEINDIGFIRWNEKAVITEVDTSFRYEGADIDNLFDLEDSVYTVSSDSSYFQEFLSNKKSQSYNTLLPIEFHLSVEKMFENLKIKTGIKYLYQANYLPYLYLKAGYLFSPKTLISLMVLQGGYGNLNIGVELVKDFGEGFILALGSSYIDGYLLPSKVSSQGAYFSIIKYFK